MSIERENEIATRRQMQPAHELLRKAQKSQRRGHETQEQKDVRAGRALRRIAYRLAREDAVRCETRFLASAPRMYPSMSHDAA